MKYSSLVSQIQNFMEDDSTELSNSINDMLFKLSIVIGLKPQAVRIVQKSIIARLFFFIIILLNNL